VTLGGDSAGHAAEAEGFTSEIERERAKRIKLAFSAREAHRGRFFDLRRSERIAERISRPTPGIRYCPLFVVACCTKLVRIGQLHAVARNLMQVSAPQSEGGSLRAGDENRTLASSAWGGHQEVSHELSKGRKSSFDPFPHLAPLFAIGSSRCRWPPSTTAVSSSLAAPTIGHRTCLFPCRERHRLGASTAWGWPLEANPERRVVRRGSVDFSWEVKTCKRRPSKSCCYRQPCSTWRSDN